MTTVSPPALPTKAPRRATRTRLALVLAALFAAAVGVSCLRLFATELSFERGYLAHAATLLAGSASALDPRERWFDATGRDGDLATDYECVGWVRTANGTPDGRREPDQDQDCAFQVHEGISGYCLYRHKTTNATRRVMRVYSNTMYRSATFPCARAPELVTYSARSVRYVHDPSFSIEDNQQRARDEIARRHANANASSMSLERGVTMVVHGGVLTSAYVSVRTLRETGSALPVEIWFKRDELDPAQAPLLADLVAHYGVFLREMDDPRATKYFTKLYAVFYSAFDNVLLMDADNFAVKDPSYLFDTPEFVDKGAIFWPDFWQPRQTTFNVQPTSLVWSILGLNFVDMFEQESGQVAINRRRHMKALNVLMFYGFSGPHVTDELQIAWGDKDLFRFAWLRTGSSFHYIQRHAGSAGRRDMNTKKFCGVAMVQHDPRGEIVFLHRNGQKLRAGTNNKLVWTHIEQFRLDAPPEKYNMGFDKVFEDIPGCWANSNPDEQYYSMTPISEFPFRDIEQRMLKLAVEAQTVEQRYQLRHSS